MNYYEMINIIDAAWEDGDLSRAEEMISGEIVKAGGEVRDIGSMGRRKLAYVIDGHSEGLYLLSHFTHPPEGLVALRDSLKLHPAVIRTLVVRHKIRPGIELGKEEEAEEAVIEIAEDEPTVITAAETPIEVSSVSDERIEVDAGEESPVPASLEPDINSKSFPGEDSADGGVKEVYDGQRQ